jgi:hypothetical protein
MHAECAGCVRQKIEGARGHCVLAGAAIVASLGWADQHVAQNRPAKQSDQECKRGYRLTHSHL